MKAIRVRRCGTHDRQDPCRSARHLPVPDMPAGRLTDVPGIRVGHWTDAAAGHGLHGHRPAAGIDRSGGCARRRSRAPAELELLAPLAGDREVTALLLTGGSAFGLAAADGVMRWCEEQGLGIDAGAARVPIVPAAVIYDLGITGNARRPGADDGYAACQAAVRPSRTRSGASGREPARPSARCWDGGVGARVGWGRRAHRLLDGATVAVLVVVNAFGDVFDERGEVLAGAWDPERGFVRAPSYLSELRPSTRG